MVDYDHQVSLGGAAGWSSVAGGRPATPEEPPKEEKKKRAGIGGVVAVQCAACGVVLLLALLVRAVGGGVYEQLRHSFHDSLANNGLLNTLAALWDGPVPAESDPDALLPESDDDAAIAEIPDSDVASELSAPAASEVRRPPEGAVAIRLCANLTACPPLAEGVLTSGYGYRDNPTGVGEQFHRGVDIAAPAGTPIAAMFGGEITDAGENESLGRYIVLSPGDGVEVLYAHCSAILVDAGACVCPGDTVALVGATGDATGNHLHICIKKDGVAYDPTDIVPVARYLSVTDRA